MSFFEISTAFVKTYSAKIKDILKQLKEKIPKIIYIYL
jgi:hypothetical protein